MSDFVTTGEEYLALTQSLLEGKKMARSLENLADSINPLCKDEEVTQILNDVAEVSRHIAERLTYIYKRNAREAFGGESERPTTIHSARVATGTIRRRPVGGPVEPLPRSDKGGDTPKPPESNAAGPAPTGG